MGSNPTLAAPVQGNGVPRKERASVNEANSGGGQIRQYALRPKNPVRAWVLAAAGLIIGIATLSLGLSGETTNVVLVVVGVVLTAFGLILGIAALAFISNRTLYVVLSPEGFEVSGPGYHKSGSWIDVDAVSATPDGARLVIGSGHIERTFIQAPGGVANDQMKALTEDIAARLRALESE